MPQTAEELVSAAIDEVNEMAEDGGEIANDDSLPLLGGETVDSLTFINLISAIEDKIQDDHGLTVTLIEDDLLDGSESVFATVGSLKAYVAEKLA